MPDVETQEERVRRIMGGASAPEGKLPDVPEKVPTEEGESQSARVARIMATDPTEVSFAEPYVPPSRGAPKAAIDPLSNFPIPEGVTPAPEDEPPYRAAARGAVRSFSQMMDLAYALDPYFYLKNVTGAASPLTLARGLSEMAGIEGAPAARATEALAEKAGIDVSEMQLKGGAARTAEKLGEESVATALLSIPIFRGARVARGTALEARRFVGPIIRFASEKPKSFIAAEIAATTGAASGRSVASESTGSQLLFGVAGAVAPGVAYGTLRRFVGVPLGNLYRNRTLWSAPQEVRVRRKAGQALLEQVGGTPERGREVAETIRKNREFFTESTGAEPTTVQASGYEPGLRAYEKARSSGGGRYASELNRELVARRAKAQEGVVEALDRLGQLNRFEQGEGSLLSRAVEKYPARWDAKELVDANLRAESEQVALIMEQQIKESQDNIYRYVVEIGGEPNPENLDPSRYSKIMREALEREEERVFQPFDEAYDSLDEYANTRQAYVSNRGLSDAYEYLLKKGTLAQGTGLPPRIESAVKILTGKMQRPFGRFVGMGEYMPFQEFRGLKKAINEALRTQSRNPDARVSVERLMRLKRAVNETLDMSLNGASRIRFAEGEGTARKLVDRPQEASQIAQTYVSNDTMYAAASKRFRDGVSGKILNPQRGPPAASATAGLYFRPGRGKGQIEAAQQFLAAAEESPQLRQTMEDYIISLAWGATNHPAKGPQAELLRRFEMQYKDALSVFPETHEKIKTLKGLVAEAEKRQLAKAAWQEEWERSAAGRWLKGDPEAAISDAMKKGPKAMRQLMSQIGDADGRAGAATVMWDVIYKKAVRYGDLGPGTSLYLEPNTFNKIIDEYAPMIRIVQGQAQVDRLRNIARASEMAFQGKIPETARNIQRSALESWVKAPIGWTYNRIYNLKTRIIRGSLYGLQWMAKRDKAQVESLLDRAILDSRLAEDLFREASTEKAQRAVVRRLRANLLTMGYRIPAEGEENQ